MISDMIFPCTAATGPKTATSATSGYGSAEIIALKRLSGSAPIGDCRFTVDTCTALPVKMLSFSAGIVGNSVKLDWQTAWELNNSGFSIERTGNGVNDWSGAGFVDGWGTTNEPKRYCFYDGKLNTGKYFYRLKQIDYNGNFEYFNLPGEVVIGVPDRFEVSQNYPNPSNPVSRIDYQIPFDAKVTIRIYDMTGREVTTLLDENKPAGYYTAKFDGTALASGIYYCRIAAGEFVRSMKVVLVK
jgi:hypothetical protein